MKLTTHLWSGSRIVGLLLLVLACDNPPTDITSDLPAPNFKKDKPPKEVTSLPAAFTVADGLAIYSDGGGTYQDDENDVVASVGTTFAFTSYVRRGKPNPDPRQVCFEFPDPVIDWGGPAVPSGCFNTKASTRGEHDLDDQGDPINLLDMELGDTITSNFSMGFSSGDYYWFLRFCDAGSHPFPDVCADGGVANRVHITRTETGWVVEPGSESTMRLSYDPDDVVPRADFAGVQFSFTVSPVEN